MKSLIQWIHRVCLVPSFFLLIYHIQLLRVPDPNPSSYIIAAFAFCVLIVSSFFGFNNILDQAKDSQNVVDGTQDLGAKYRVDFIQERFPEILESVNETDRGFLLFIEGRSDFPSVFRQLEIVIDRGENEIIEKIDSDLSRSIDIVRNKLNSNIRKLGQLKTANINVITEKWTQILMQEKHKGISEEDLSRNIMDLSRREIFIGNLGNIPTLFDDRMYARIANYGENPYPEQFKDDFITIVKEQNKEYDKLLSETIKMRKDEIVDTIILKLKQYIKNPI